MCLPAGKEFFRKGARSSRHRLRSCVEAVIRRSGQLWGGPIFGPGGRSKEEKKRQLCGTLRTLAARRDPLASSHTRSRIDTNAMGCRSETSELWNNCSLPSPSSSQLREGSSVVCPMTATAARSQSVRGAVGGVECLPGMLLKPARVPRPAGKDVAQVAAVEPGSRVMSRRGRHAAFLLGELGEENTQADPGSPPAPLMARFHLAASPVENRCAMRKVARCRSSLLPTTSRKAIKHRRLRS